MSKRKNEFFVMDIYISILKIEEYTKDIKTAQELQYDCKTWDAVIRELEIIGEATKNLIENGLFDNDKRKIVDFRNIIVHHYFGINEDIVWDVLKSKIPDLKIELIEMINSYENKKELLDCFIKDNQCFDFIKTGLMDLEC
jgi:uncharacterized protein with HEPN domain